MSIPESCTVLVIGGGPGGSYVASTLAREGVDTVLLEADEFPRYHIGESMLASFRFFLRFIGLESKFDDYGFVKKLGAAFKINEKREGYTDFIAANGPGNHSWNVIRSEADDLMFKHAASCGARAVDGTKVTSIEFKQSCDNKSNLGRPVSASWSRKDGRSGVIKYEYLVDASGRAGLVSTKYMKNRKFNQGLKNVAQWAYWKGVQPYGVGTNREGQPLFEALNDGSGWVWNIPLHDGTMSVGVVIEQGLAKEKKKAVGTPTDTDFYLHCLRTAPTIATLMKDANMVSGLTSASDYSYSASSYASPYLRIVGDAGCFIDPYFSSGVHLALSSALSAAVTIQAARRGDCDEATAVKWHTDKVAESYTIFLLVVITTLKQIRAQMEPILSDFDEDGFDRAFSIYRPIIQGTADADFHGRLTQTEVSNTVDFCLNAFEDFTPDDEQKVIEKVQNEKGLKSLAALKAEKTKLEMLSDKERQILRGIQARKMLQCDQSMTGIHHFAQHEVNGFTPRLAQGSLGLNKVPIN